MILTCFLSCTCAQSHFTPLVWTPKTLLSGECELVIHHDLSGVLATLAELIKSNDTASSLLKSCMEIKESSPVSASGYYTINNGSVGSVVVYCNMDGLYSCSSLEQTLNGFSNTLVEVSNTLPTNSSCERIPISC